MITFKEYLRERVEVEFNDIIKYKGEYYYRHVNGNQTRHRDGTISYKVMLPIEDEREQLKKNRRLVGMALWINSEDIEEIIKHDTPQWKKLVGDDAEKLRNMWG